MADTDLAERVRQYGLLLDRYAENVQGYIRNLSQQNLDNTWRQKDDLRRFSELQGQETAYMVALREFKEKFPELYQAKPETE